SDGSLMDSWLDSGLSAIVVTDLKKDGQFYSDTKIANEQSFKELRDYVHELTVRSAIEMTSVSIELNPYENKQVNACTFSSFKSVCQFDPSLKTNNFKHLQNYDDETIFEKIKEINEKGGK